MAYVSFEDLEVWKRLGTIISEEKAMALISEVKEISNMLQGLIRSQKQ
jgi:hypothetical protein